MIDKQAKQVVLEYVLAKEQNLKTALLVVSAYEDLKKAIISAFAKDLKRELEAALGAGWVVDCSPLLDRSLDKWKGFWIRKQSWGDRYKIGLEAQQYGPRNFILGVCKTPDERHLTDLKAALDEKAGQGKSHDWWVWYQRVGNGYDNWDTETALVSMWFQRESAVAYFRDQIMALKNVAEAYIDQAIGTP